MKGIFFRGIGFWDYGGQEVPKEAVCNLETGNWETGSMAQYKSEGLRTREAGGVSLSPRPKARAGLTLL